ncbi:MAG: hypothetical protein H8E37_09535 [Planctomycetes bacterium]|nr:hypothetical protein [Planctomycetota bacterium]
MSRIATALLALFAGSLLAAPLHAEDGLKFRFKAKTGEKRYYEVSSKMEMSQKIAGMDLDTKMDSKQTVEREVTEPTEDGTITLRDRTLRLQMTSNFPGVGEYKYDSKSTDNNDGSAIGAAIAPLYDAISGAITDITLTPQGDVKKAKGLAEAVKGAIGNNPIAQQFAAGADNDEAVAHGMKEHFIQFPEKALAAGDEWEVPFEFTLPKLGKATGTTKYKYEGIDEESKRKGLHKFSFTSSMDFDLDLKTEQVKATGKLKISDSSGTALFDAAAGRLISKKSKTTVGGDLNIDAGGMTIAIQQEQTQHIELKVLDGPPED